MEEGNDGSVGKPDLWIGSNTRCSSVGMHGAGGEP
jgi:hypothetical protein